MLYGLRTGDGWVFSRELINQTALMLDEPEIKHTSQFVDSWNAALGHLDRYLWHKFYPVKVHVDFMRAVLDAVISRFTGDRYNNSYHMSRW